MSASDAEGGAPMIERMTLSKMRACTHAGAYQNDRTSQEERRLRFLRWLVRQDWLDERQVAEGSEAGPPEPGSLVDH